MGCIGLMRFTQCVMESPWRAIEKMILAVELMHARVQEKVKFAPRFWG
jgi:hypothetical protein